MSHTRLGRKSQGRRLSKDNDTSIKESPSLAKSANIKPEPRSKPGNPFGQIDMVDRMFEEVFQGLIKDLDSCASGNLEETKSL